MKLKILLLTIILFSLKGFSQIQDPAQWSFEKKVTGKNTADLILKAKLESGWHLYGLSLPEGGPIATTITFDALENAVKSGGIQPLSKLIKAHDPNFDMELNWYANEAVFVQKITFTDPNAVYAKVKVRYMLCNDQTCLSPTSKDFTLGTPGQKTAAKSQEKTLTPAPENQISQIVSLTTNTDSVNTKTDSLQKVAAIEPANKEKLWEPVINELKTFGSSATEKSSLWWIFLTGFLGGLLALVMPCIWPIIPMTISFFLKRSKDKARGRRDAVFYGLAIIVIYLALGLLITLFFGASALNSLSTNAVFNVLIFLILVIFAISFFGAFEISLPASWASKMDAKADSTTGIMSILFMAFTLVLVSFSCTGPIIGLVLVDVFTKGSLLGPAVAMFGFSLALAIPFAFFAFFPSLLQSMPKSGGWLNKVKVVLAFLELAFALKFLSVADLAYNWGILDREVFLALWIIIFVLLGVYLLGKMRFSHDDETKHTSVLGLFLAIISFAFAVYMVPGLWGAPLKAVSAFAPPSRTQDFDLYENDVHPKFLDYELGMAYAASVGKPALIDFTGHGCVNCRKMEVAVWTDEKVRDMINNDFVLISLYVDEKAALVQPYEVIENGKTTEINSVGDKWSYLQRHKFASNAQPFYLILDAQGKPLTRAYPSDKDKDYLNPDNFVKWLNSSKKK